MPKKRSASFVHASFSETDLAKRWEDFIVNEEKGSYQLHGNPASCWDWRRRIQAQQQRYHRKYKYC